MFWITDGEREMLIKQGVTCVDCTFRNDCEDDEICCDFYNEKILDKLRETDHE